MSVYKNIHKGLIEKCKKGDSKSQYRLYHLYSEAMYSICIRMLANKMDAEDVLQEAFVTTFKNIKTFRGDSSFGAWLKRLVINKCLDFLKKKKINFIEIENETVDLPDCDKKIEWPSADIIHNEIKQLPEGCRIIFTLFLLEGMKHKEIAELLDVSESTSKSQYQRAKQILQERLTNPGNNNHKMKNIISKNTKLA